LVVKVKQSHNTPMEAQGERRYSSYSFSTSLWPSPQTPLEQQEMGERNEK
jgi:hypothetical protein